MHTDPSACPCSLPFFFLKTPVKKPGDGRKVTFFEPSHGDENGTSKCNPLGPMCSGFAWFLCDSVKHQ